MIDLQKERLLRMAKAAQVRPPGRNNRPTHPSTIARWIHRGVRGVKLEGIRLGGTLYTSIEALQRFADNLSRLDNPTEEVRSTPSASRVRSAEQANALLDNLGY
jgi:hypothetical protein